MNSPLTPLHQEGQVVLELLVPPALWEIKNVLNVYSSLYRWMTRISLKAYLEAWSTHFTLFSTGTSFTLLGMIGREEMNMCFYETNSFYSKGERKNKQAGDCKVH